MAIAGFGGVRPPDLGGRRPTGFTGTATPRTKPTSDPYTPPNAPAGSSFLPRPIFDENPMTFTQFGPIERGQLRPTGFGGTAASPTTMPAPRAPGDPRRDPWEDKGTTSTGPESPDGTDPAPSTPPAQTFFEKFPTPQEAWKDWIARMGQFLAREPGEAPNFPGPWGPVRRIPTNPLPAPYQPGTLGDMEPEERRGLLGTLEDFTGDVDPATRASNPIYRTRAFSGIMQR